VIRFYRRGLMPYLCVIAVFFSALSLVGCGGGSATPDPNAIPTVDALKATCVAMKGKVFASATVTAANRIEANGALGSPGMCQVLATRAPYLDIQVYVPDNWSGRLYEQGGGGTDGLIYFPGVRQDASGALTFVSKAISQLGMVYAGSNGGNRANVPSQAGPAVWFDGTDAGKQSMVDYSYAASGTTLFFSKAVVREFFGRDAKYRYFNGCSNGGRNAYIAIERWPNEYDGVVAGCEGMDMGGQTVAWMDMARLVGTPAMPQQAQWTSVYKAAVAACDTNDNLADGIIANYTECSFDPLSQQCGQPGASTDPNVCLSSPQLGTVRRLLGALISPTGNMIYSGHNLGNWTAPSYGFLGSSFTAIATGDSSWLTQAKISTFDLNVDYGPVAAGLQAAGADHDKIAIAAFIASGKKLINWHDGADELLSFKEHARNVVSMHSIAKTMGLADPSSNSRLFIVPGTPHAGGSGLIGGGVDWATSIVDWVEKGIAPSQLTYSSPPPGVAKSLPVCQYPAYPRYISGDVNASSSYSCTAP
jgi:hypothetical protein